MSGKMPKSSTTGNSSGGNIPQAPPRNRFQKSGHEGVFEVRETKKACVMRVDMPGCPESDLVYWVDAQNIHFFADEPAMPQYENGGRKYGGSIVINPLAYDVKEAKARLLNGVLWVTVPKIPGIVADINVIEGVVYWPVTREHVAPRRNAV